MTNNVSFIVLTAASLALLPSCGDESAAVGGGSAQGGSPSSGSGGAPTGGYKVTVEGNLPFAGAGGVSEGGSGGEAGEGEAAVAGEGGMDGSGGGSAGLEPLSDAQILDVTLAANQGEIDQAKVAQARAQDPEVREFAELVQTAHSAAFEAGSELAEEIGGAENAVSVRWQSGSEAMLAQLESASEAEFDVLYMYAEVTVHSNVLTLLDEQLIEQADSARLRDHLAALRASVAEHFELAAQIAGNLR